MARWHVLALLGLASLLGIGGCSGGSRDEKLNIDAHRDVPSISASAWKVRAVAKRTHLPRQACHPATYPLQKPQRVGHPSIRAGKRSVLSAICAS